MVEQILSHATYIAIGIVAVIMIISTIYGFKADVKEATEIRQMDFVAAAAEAKILELNSMSGKDFAAKVLIDSPENYLLSFSGYTMTISGSEGNSTRTIPVAGSGEAYLPAYIIYEKGSVVVK